MFAKILVGVVATVGLASGGYYVAGDSLSCCTPGAACCVPGAPCCDDATPSCCAPEAACCPGPCCDDAAK